MFLALLAIFRTAHDTIFALCDEEIKSTYVIHLCIEGKCELLFQTI